MSTSHDINFTFKFAPGSPLSSDATSDQINQIVSGMHRLYDSIGTLYIPLLNAFADSYFSPLIAEVRNEIESNKKAIKELGKLPPKSRAKTAIAREKADAKRNQMTQRRNLLKTTKAELKEKLTNLQEQSKKGSTSAAILWRQLMDKMRSASYSTYGDNTIGSPHYLDVFDAFQQMMAEFSRDLFSSPDWTSELDAFKQLINDASDNNIMAAIVQISITARARLFPSDISWKQVSDNLRDDNGDVKVPQGQFELCNLVTLNTQKRQQKAIECAQIAGIDKVGGASLLQISHVDDLLNDIIHGSVKNAFLSAPMGGVYNCEVNGVLYNSGSKTGGVMMPMIKHALRSGVKTTIIVHRVSLTRDLLARIREEVKAAMPGNEWRYIWHYNEQHYDSAQVLVTCMNSLDRDDIKAFLTDSACVIIDEFSQVQDNYNLIEAHQVNQRKTQEDCYRQAAAINETIMTAIASPEVTFVAMDADLETGLLTPIIELTNTASFTKVYKIQHPECQLPPKERTKQALFHRNKQSHHHFTAKITQHCQARQNAIAKGSNAGRFCIATDSRALTYTFEALCHSCNLKVCVINSDTSEAKDSDANKLLRRQLKPEDFDVVIMSPTITSGCSWITPSYKDCVVVACGVIPSYNLKQMAFRFRSITQIDVFAYPAQYDDIPPLDEFDIELANNIAHDYQYSSLLVMIRQHRTDLAKEATKNQRSYLYWQLEDEGWGCSTYDPTLYISDDNEEVPETNSSERTDRIMKAKKLSLSEYKAIHTNSRWHEDVLACVRFSASLNIAVSHNESDVRLALSPQHEISTRRIIKEVYASYKSELGLLLDEFMSDLFGSDWQ